MESILTKNQKKEVLIKNTIYKGENVDLYIHIRYDDCCGNGHNSFSITGDLYAEGRNSHSTLITCGCIHDIIAKLAPEYKKYIKWHLMSSNSPLHYIENTIYWATKEDKHTNFIYLVDE
jgi:hypothetical protein